MQLNLSERITEQTQRLMANAEPESKESLTAAACKMYGDYWDLCLLDFLTICEGDLTFLGVDDLLEMTNGKAAWLMGFGEFVEKFANACNKLKVPESAESRAAHRGEVELTTREGMLIFARSYFGFHTFEEAGQKVNLAEFLVARKDVYNTAKYNKNRADDDKRKSEQKAKYR